MYKRKISDRLKIAANQKLKERDYWIKTLGGELEKTYFYYDKLAAGEEAAGDAYQTITFNYENELWQKLMKLSNNADFRLHMILVAGVVALLHKYTGHSDIIVGSPIYKQEQDIEFINTVLPLRNQIGTGMTFKQLLLQVRQVVIDAMENQNFPIEILVEKLSLSTPENRDNDMDFPLFDVMILVENIHDKKYIQHIPTNTIFSFLRTDHSLQGVLTYNAQRYETSKMQRLITHLTCLLREVLASADKKISSVTILSLEEKNQILFEFNNTKKDLRRDICYRQLFEKQAVGNPNKIVAADHLQQITYNKLNEEANRIAHFLIREGLKADTIAAIYMDRSVNMLAAIIGIFKAGGAYLGIDIALPEGRIRNILEDSKIKVIITETENLEVVNQIKERLPHLQTVLCWQIDNKGASIDKLKEYPTKNPGTVVPSSSLAYIIYTSGTTGKPKGVMIHQLGMINHLYANIDFLDITGSDTIAQTASLSFDISVWQFLAAPILGGVTYIIGYEVVLDPTRLVRVLQKGRITILEAVPSLMSALLETVRQEGSKELKDLRWMLPTGEALSVALANRWYGYYPGIKLVNAYGPAEASDDVTLWVLDAAALENQSTIPIGKPLQNLHIYIMGPNLSLCPVRVPGEICIAGIGVGKGYLNDPGKTAKSFLPNPYVGAIGDQDYSTLYKTGDMGYFTEDGNIEFLGRQDYQVKVRGFRIELEEIQHQLLRLDEIKEAVVVPHGESDDKYLCAYIVSNTTSPLSISTLRDFLSQELPYYMIPSYFFPLDKIPLTPNGKIDRKALPAPEIKTGHEYIEPRNEMEKKLIKIWSDILEVDEGIIGIDTNFFELGGHSLKAILFISKIHKELNVIVPLADIFKYQTIRGLSDYIESAEENKFETIAAVEKKEYYEVSPAQRRIYLSQQLDKNSTAYNLPFVITLENVIDKKRGEEKFKKLIERHESLRTSFEMIDKELVQKIHREVDFQIKFYRTGEEKEIKQLIKNFIKPFDLLQAPILRVGLIEVTEEKDILMFDMHHIISDGLSGDVLAKDFIEINNGKELAPLRIQYKDFSLWQNQLFQSEHMEKQKGYWLQQFEDGVPVLHLPLDYPRPSVRSFEGSTLSFELSPELTRALNLLASENEATLFMVLLGIYYILLHKLSGQEDIVVGTSIAARGHVDLEGIVGMFVNNLPLRNFPSGEKTFITFLKEVKQLTLEAFENQDYQFDDLIERAAVDRDTSRNPLFDTLLALQNMGADSRETSPQKMPHLEINPYEIEHLTSKFDIHLTCIETEEKIHCTYEYSTKLFKKETVEQFITYFEKIVLDITENPRKEISGIEIISEEERKQILEGVGSTDLEYQRERILLTSKFMKQRAYWLNRLPPGMEKTELFLKHKREKEIEEKLEGLEILITGQLFNRLVKLGKQSALSLYLILLTALKVLIHRYTNNEDVIVVSPVYKQNVSEETLNHRLFIRDNIDGELTFADLLLEIRKSVLEAYENQDYPSHKLIEYLLGTSRTKTDNPISDIVCLLSNIHDTKGFERPGTGLIFSFLKEESQLTGQILYDRNVYEKEYIQLISKHLLNILDNLTEDIKTKISGISFFSKEEEKQFIDDFNQTAAAYPKEKTLVHLFEEQVEKTPEKIAVIEQSPGGEVLRYREFNEKSNQLAHLLRAKGVKPNTIVAIMVERSFPMLIGLMAILKAGGAFLPINIEYPEPMKKFILEDSGARMLLTQEHLFQKDKENMERYPCQEIILIDEERSPAAGHDDPGVIHHPMNPAYIIYTSGTSGKPKGVMVHHQAIVNYIWWAVQNYVKDETANFPLYTSISFDLTMTSIFTPLITGNTIVLYRDEEEPLLMGRIITDDNVAVIKCTPSHLKLIKYTEGRISPNNIKRFVVGGEKLDRDLALEIHEKFNGNIEIYNEYGPTEATVGCMIYKFDPQYNGIGSVPIGKPIHNTQIYILDRHLYPVPFGVPGQLCISGDGVALGYLKREQLTGEKFTPHPFIKDKGKRLYRSGDLARRLLDGNIEFLGRIDNQVKIRGFRIELEEIANHLLNHPEIKNAVVLAKEMETGDKYLCAYLVSNKEIIDSELKKYLSQYLPDYMIPLFFKYLEAIPLTINGKIDSKALQKLDIEAETKYQAPGNKKELLLAKIWQDVLGLKRIGLNDNFFMLGGDSIKTIQIASRLNKEGYKVEMRDIFLHPTISKLSPFLRKTERIPDQSIIHGNVPLTPIQRWFFENKLVDSHHFNHAVMLFSREGLGENAVKAVFKKIQEHHDALRMTFKEKNREMIQINQGLESPLTLEVYDLKNRENAKETLEQIAIRLQASIDLENGPLMKLGLFHLDDGDRLLIVIHHLVIDGVSWRILVEDIETLYQQYKNRENFKLPLKSDSFKLWAEKLSVYANSELLLKEKTYWAKIESTAVPTIKRDFEEDDNYLKDTDSLSFSLSEEETKNLMTKVNYPFGTEINDILLTALGLGINKIYGNKQVLIALEGHGREGILEDININRTIGWFTSLIPVILDFSFAADLSRQIKEIKECLSQVPHKGIGHGILKYLTAEHHKKEIEFKITPQISFNYLGQIDEDMNSLSFEIAKESPGNTQSMRQKRNYDLDVSGITANKQLQITIVYNKKQYKSETIAAMLNHYKKELSRIISYCSTREKQELTPSDFTYKKLSIETVDQLNKQYQYNLEDIYTLSPMQEGMLFHALLDYTSPAYFEQVTYGFSGELDASLVEKSLNELFKRYDILRTAFVQENDGIHRPIQLVLKERQVDFYYEDLRSVTDKAERETLIEEFKQKDKARLFDLGKDVLMRVSILRTANAEYKFIWSFHHILMDGWCTGILISDFFEIYNSYLQHRPYQLPGVKPFSTYIQWLEQRDMEISKNYWQAYLSGYDEIASIPGKKITNHQEKVYKNESVSLSFDRIKTNALVELASGNHVTLNTIIQTVWGILLGKYNGKQAVVYGAVVSGRPPEVEDVESMVGLFINTVPVRISFEENSTFTFNQLLQKVQEEAIKSEPHHYCPLAEIQARSSLKQNLLDHIMIYENYPIGKQLEELTAGNHPDEAAIHLELSDIDVFEQTNYDFNIVAAPGEQLTIHLDYNGNVYQRDRVLRISNHLNKLFQQIIDSNDEELPIEAITLITEEEKAQILTEFNKTGAEFPQDKTIHELFEAQAERTPDNIAAVGQSARHTAHAAEEYNTLYARQHALTYKELNENANQMARILREKGTALNTIAAIMIQRSIEMLIGIFGILKAGGAYMPIETDSPRERLDYMLKDSAANVLVTTGSLFEEIKKLRNLEVKREQQTIFIDSYEFSNSSSSHRLNFSTSHPADLAYVIYTSGSTGRPKGVLVQHASVVNLTFAQMKRFKIDKSDRILQFSSICFDASVQQIFLALPRGAVLVLIGKDTLLHSDKFDQFICRQAVTHIHAVPSFLNTLELKHWSHLKRMIAGGEVCPVMLAKRWSPYCDFYNEYGPTETTVTSIEMLVKEVDEHLESLPIGKPIDNTFIYLLDKKMNLVPLGVPGELYIGGDGVTRGYLNRPALTAEKFTKNLFTGGRWYQTGDLAIWLFDGNIQFLGRIDHQVKIRGFRIELEEIESQLQTHDQIKEAVVTTQKDANEDNYLCAYMVPLPSHSLNNADLREYLSARLPDYMIPSLFMSLEKIPLTPSGKVDRRALPDPEFGAGTTYAAPQNWTEEKLTEIWSEILGIDREASHRALGIDDNFFALGGHSLKATILVSKIHKAFNVKVPLADVFEIPTIRGLSTLIKGAGEDKYTAIKSVEKKDYYVLSSSQMRLYILQQMDLQSIGYNIPQAVKLKGEPGRKKLEEAFVKLIRRHESLRTSFVTMEEQPVQLVQKPHQVEFKIEYHEAEGEEPSQVEAMVRNFVRAFDLSAAPLLRVGLIKSGNESYILMVDIHHIVTDGFSHEIFLEDFLLLYSGEELPGLRLQYKDYAQWQASRRQKDAVKLQEEFWLKEFAGEIPVLDLPADYARPSFQGFEGSTVSFEISKKETAALKNIALEEGATMFMVLLAITAIFLSKLTGQEDIVIGTPVAGRSHDDLGRIIGMFVNTLALRNRPEGERTFNTFLSELKEKTLQAFENQNYQFEELVEKVNVKRDVSRNPLFDVMFSIMEITAAPAEDHEREIPDIKLTPYEYENRTSKFDMSIDAKVADNLSFDFEFSTKLFKRNTIERFTTFFKQIISSVIKDPGRILSGIEIISQEEKNWILIDFNGANGTEMWYPGDKPVYRLFEEQVDKVPGKIAAVFKNDQLTYSELSQQARQWGKQLRRKGVKPETLVPIMVERSLEMIVGVMAVLEAGGAYLPIDAAYPQERINYMLADSGADVLVTTNSIAKEGKIYSLSSWKGERLILDTVYRSQEGITEEINLRCCGDPAPLKKEKEPFHHSSFSTHSHHGERIAYVIYTSGSTGKPKGVMVQNNHYVNAAFAWKKEYRLTEIEVNLLQMAGFSFDVFAGDLVRALLNGGKLVVCPEEVRLELDSLYRLIREHRISLFEATPSFIIPLMEYVYENQLEIGNLELLILGSDICTVEDFKKLVSRFGREMRIINSYGVTEATIDTSFYEGNLANIPLSGNVPIGKPLPNMKCYVMDGRGGLQPLGIAGELYIGGKSVTRGYLNRILLTSQRFLANPFIPREKVYKTGDLVRCLSDGNMEFLGRVDLQVKIRGYRIESGEIENRLLTHPQVKEAVVQAKETGPGDKYLCAYIVSAGEDRASQSSLKEYLAKDLPDYMIPGYFVFLEKMPLTANGKVDRKSLPLPELVTTGAYVKPVNEVEEKLAGIWSEVLGVEANLISVEANFFELGGHSLKATMLVLKIHKAFNVKVPLLEIFKTPEIRGLAEYIERAGEDKFAAIEPVEKKEYYVLSSTQRRLYVLQQMDEQGTGYNIPAVCQLDGNIDTERVEHVVTKLIKRHESFRTYFEIVGDEPVQKVLPFPGVEFHIEYPEPGRDMPETRLIKQFVRPFNLSRAPLLRAGLIKIAEGKNLLVVDVHHIISDAVSDDLLIQDFFRLYDDEKLPGLKLQYKDYAEWQNRLYHSQELKKQETYWLQQFDGNLPVINLPTDYPRPSFKGFEGSKVTFQLGKEETAGLKNMALEWGTTLYMVLLALYNVFLSKVSHQEDIIVGSAIAGRRHADLEKIVGMFVNTLVLRNYPRGNRTFTDFLKEVKERTLDAFENQDYQFEDLVDQVAVDRDTSRNPLFDVTFAFLDEREERVPVQELEKLAANQGQYESQTDVSKFDMTLAVVVQGENILFTIVYSTKLFKEKTIKLLTAWFKNVAGQILISPEKQLKTYHLGTGREKELYNYLGVPEEKIECFYPVTPTQRDIYLDCKINPDARAHRRIFYYVIDKKIDIKAWQESLTNVHRIYPILRAQLVNHEDNIYLAIRRRVELDFNYLDLAGEGLHENEIEEKIKQITRSVTHNLNQELITHYLIKVRDEVFINMLSFHHIIFDGPSLKILFEKLHEIYENTNKGNSVDYKEEIKAHDVFINYQHSILESFDSEAVEEYWRKKFTNVQKLQSSVQGGVSSRFVYRELLIEKAHLDKIQSYCSRHSISLAFYFRVLYALLIRFHFGVEEDFIIRELFGSRDETSRDFLGCFFHTIPLVFQREMLDENNTIGKYFKNVFALMMQMRGKETISIFLQNRLLGEEDMIFYYNYRDISLLDISNRKYYLHRVPDNPDSDFHPKEVQLITKENEKGFFLEIEYNEAYFNGGQFLQRLLHVSRQVVDGVKKLGDINFTVGDELQEILACSSGRSAAFPSGTPLFKLFQQQAEKEPDSAALEYDGRTITYGHLNKRTNQMAHYLVDNYAIGTDQLVGVMLDRSHLVVESILATWKAGGAYIPIDPDWPTQRVLDILNDSGSRVLLTQSTYIKPGLEEAWGGSIIVLDRDAEEIHRGFNAPEQNTANLELGDVDIDMSSLAYVIYTSGSTGKPKGAMVEHIGMMNHIQAKIDDLQLTCQSVVAQNASYTFDISVWQFFVSLVVGGKTVIYPTSLVLEPIKFLSRLSKDRITILEVVPSYLSVILESHAGLVHRVSLHLDYLLVTGETLKPNLVNQWFEMYPGIKMVNAYGPTEASDDITHHVMEEAPGIPRVPIGKPLQNLNIYIVEKNMNLCPFGVKGEICVSGVGVGRGYLNNPELTSEKFINYKLQNINKKVPFGQSMAACIHASRQSHSLLPRHPTPPLPHAPIYLTGDLGCWLPDGTIDFFGRKDYQVKIRGFRIELGEIENKLVNHPSVKDAVVVDREYLCAYIVPAKDLDEGELREYLSNELPDYMIPSCFVQIEKIPLTANGKTDRKALPAPDKKDLESGIEYRAPGNKIEEKLVEIWEKVLGRKPIGINDNFFQLGGDSIKSIQIASRMNTLGYKLEIRDIFQNPVISKLASRVVKAQRTADQSPVTGDIPLTPIQKDFFSNSLECPHHYNLAVMLYSKDGFAREAVKEVFTRIQEHHDALRVTYHRTQENIIQTNHGVEYPLSLQVYDLRNHENAARALETSVNEIQKSIDLEKGPLMKLGLIHLEDGDRLLIVVHHLVIDGISWRILLEDIECLYQQYIKGEPLALPLKTDSFKLWSENLSEYANSELFLKEKNYWLKMEEAGPPPLEKDFNGENDIQNEAVLSFTLSEEETEDLLTKANEPFATEINDILLTALGLSTRKSCGNTRVLIALEGHGREEILKDINITRTVGWFTTLYPLVLDVTYEDDLSRQIKEVKEQLRQVPNKGIGYGILKHLTAAEHKEDLQFKLLPQICFNYFGQFDSDIKQVSFGIARESVGDNQNPAGKRRFELEIAGAISDKKLVISIIFSKNQFKVESIESLLNSYREELRNIISYCCSQETRQLSPSDFTYKELSIEEVGTLSALFN